MVPKQCQQQNDRQRHAKQPKQSTFSKIHGCPPPRTGRRWRSAKVPSAKSWCGSTERGPPHRRSARSKHRAIPPGLVHSVANAGKKGPSAGGRRWGRLRGCILGTIRRDNEHQDGSFHIGRTFSGEVPSAVGNQRGWRHVCWLAGNSLVGASAPLAHDAECGRGLIRRLARKPACPKSRKSITNIKPARTR